MSITGPNSIMVQPGSNQLTQAQQQQISQKVAQATSGGQVSQQQAQPPMNASQSYQQPNGHQQVFFKKRASSNTNPPANHTQSIVQGSPPKAVDNGPATATENGQQMEKSAQPADSKGSEGGKLSSPKTSAGATTSLQPASSAQGPPQSSTSASSMTQAQSQNAQQPQPPGAQN